MRRMSNERTLGRGDGENGDGENGYGENWRPGDSEMKSIFLGFRIIKKQNGYRTIQIPSQNSQVLSQV